MIKLFVMDVDGTMTDGAINISSNGELFKSFNVKDGYAISRLPRKGCLTCIITTRESGICEKRSKEINITYLFQGVESKLNTLVEIATKLGIARDEIAYIGDDLNDLDCIKYVGVSACPSDSYFAIKNQVNYVCEKNGGYGCVREFIDYLIKEGMVGDIYDI